MFYSCEESISRKIWYFPLRNLILSLVLPRNAIMLHPLIIQFLLYYRSSGCLWEVKNKRKCQTFSSKSGRVAEERWSLRRVSRKWRFDCTLYPVSLNSILVSLNNVKVSLNSAKVGLFLVSSQ